MNGFVAHDGTFCYVATRDGLLVDLDPRLPRPGAGQPAVGACKNCGDFGVVYEVPPLAEDVAEDLAAFTRWLDASLSWAEDVGEEHTVEHRALALLHAPVEIVRFGVGGGPPAREVACSACQAGGFPCQTIRVVARIYRHPGSGWREAWAPATGADAEHEDGV
ncbi:hypothetical protein ACFWYW_46810 [Nonomuraea sp. NPDC059023]|uniref:hypothetical protein n=1 Tax=unclassified Nonomuraea TaxID=2593643 RepID=UPI0036CB58ED